MSHRVRYLFYSSSTFFQLKFGKEKSTRGGYYWHSNCSKIPGANHMYSWRPGRDMKENVLNGMEQNDKIITSAIICGDLKQH